MNAPAQTMMKDPFVYEDGTTILADPTYKYFFQLRKDMEETDKSAKPYSDVLAAKLNYRTEFLMKKRYDTYRQLYGSGSRQYRAISA